MIGMVANRRNGQWTLWLMGTMCRHDCHGFDNRWMDGQTVIYNSRVVFATETVSLFTSSEDIKPATITVTRLQRALETELAVGLGQL